MQKKLLALAVAGVLAAPVAAMAQSSVTISGVLKESFDRISISSATARPAGANLSEWRVTDNSSRIIFGITEDIGGGLSGIGQIDMRPTLDTVAGNATGLAAGNSWVGVRSTSWGTVTLGRHDLHYGKQPDDIAAKAGALQAASVSLMDYTWLGSPIANASRTSNVIRYDSPNWSGFAFTAAYSANSGGMENDINSSVRRGAAYNFNPSYTTANWGVYYSYWNSKSDNAAAVSASLAAALGLVPASTPVAQEEKAHSVGGYYKIGGFKVGLGLNKSKVEGQTTGGSGKIADRTNWTIPVSWTSGPHNIYAHYTKAGKDKAADDLGISNTDAKMYALAYVYDLSKRTSVGVTYAKIDNNTGAAYNFFTNGAVLGSTSSALGTGEDGTLISFTVRHAF